MTEARQNKKIRTGDQVIVIAGNERGQIGTVLSRTDTRAVVQGINLRKKHQRRTQANARGSIIEIEAPLHISNLKLCPRPDKAVKVRKSQDADGKALVYRDGDQTVRLRSIKKSQSE